MGADANTLTADQAHEQRSKVLFLGFLSSVLGVDQNMVADDGLPMNTADRYQIANGMGGVSVAGQPISNQQTPLAAAGVSPGMLLLFAGLVFLLAR